MSDKLRYCPFCGRPDARVRDFEESAINVSCKCGVQIFGGRAHFGSREEAIAAWNRRASPAPAIPACVGCEGKPAAGNDPCSVCGKSTAPAISESEDARDAARYRWLRDHFRFTDGIEEIVFGELILIKDDPANLDVAIDAARDGGGS